MNDTTATEQLISDAAQRGLARRLEQMEREMANINIASNQA